MTKPHVAACQPKEVELVEGKKYAWCACGYSEKQPFCDGAHKKCELRPMVFTAQKTEKAYLCQCKYSKNPPYCDGSHNDIVSDVT